MFRTVCKSFRLFNGLASSSCRVGEPVGGLRADDVTKFTTGILHQMNRESHNLSNHHHHHDHDHNLRRYHYHQCTILTHPLPSLHDPLSIQRSSLHHLNHHHPLSVSCYPVLTNVNCPESICDPSLSSTQLCSVLRVARYSTSGKDGGNKPEASSVQAKPPASGTVDGSVSSADSAAGEGQKEAEGGEQKLSIFKRFKQAYKEHGKVLVAVHIATSLVWYSSFYAIARGGVDIVPYMEQWGFSDTVIKPFRAGGLGDFAVAYLMYKLATPARYTVTLAGTNMAIRYLRRKGRMAPKVPEDSLREFYKEGRQRLKNSKLRQERLKKLRAARDKRKRTGGGTGGKGAKR